MSFEETKMNKKEKKSYIKRFIEANINHIIKLYKDFNCPLVEYSFELKGINCEFENSYFRLWLKKSYIPIKENQKEFHYGIRFQQIEALDSNSLGISEILGISAIKCEENNPKKFYELINKALE